MAQLIDIIRVVVDPEYLTATVQLSPDAPLMTSEDLEGTTRVYNLMPTIIDHACVGDAGDTFKDCMGHTVLAHLLEHVTVELLARTNMVDTIVAGRTWRELAYDRTFSIQLDCVDDVLVAGALSSAVWIVTWAFTGGAGPVPDVEATVEGLAQLVEGLSQADDASYDDARGGYDDGYGNAYDDPYDNYGADAYEDPYGSYDDEPYDDAYDEYGEELGRGPRMSRKII